MQLSGSVCAIRGPSDKNDSVSAATTSSTSGADGTFVAPLVVGILFIGLPWLVLHYLTRWRTAATLTREDENLLDELYDLARRLEDRMTTIERIIAADDPNWKKGA